MHSDSKSVAGRSFSIPDSESRSFDRRSFSIPNSESRSLDRGSFSIPGSVMGAFIPERELESSRSTSRHERPFFYPTPIPTPSSFRENDRHLIDSQNFMIYSPTSMLMSFNSPPPSLSSLLDVSLSSAVSQQSRVSSLASKLGSDVSIAIFTPENSLRSRTPSDYCAPYYHRTPLKAEKYDGSIEVLPCTPSFLPLMDSKPFLGKRGISPFSRKEGTDLLPKKTAENGFTPFGPRSTNGMAIISLSDSASIYQPNGWIERELTADIKLKDGLSRVENSSLNGITNSNGGMFPKEVKSITGKANDTDSGCIPFSWKLKNKSSTASDPDAIGMGTVSVTASRADLVGVDDDDDDDESEECGWLCFRPKFLQQTRTAKWVLFWLCWAAAAQGMVVNGFVNVCITTIEKRFELRSTDTGLIAGAYDIASVVCSVPVSYLGSRPGSSKPRWLGLGVFIMGLGSFFFTVPHFASPEYNPSGNNSLESLLLCLREANSERQCRVVAENWLSSFRHIFILGQFLHGVGASPLYTLGITYLDESVPVKMSSLYLGIFYAMAVIGPAFGYLLGGQFLKVYIDAPSVNPEKYNLNHNSDLWLGSWWIGLLLSGTISILISGPIMAFPSQLPGAKAIKAERVSEAHGSEEEDGRTSVGFGRLRDLPTAIKILILNPTFVMLSLAGATEGILLAGFATFMPKFLENQFSMSASFAALLVGCVVVPAGGGGTLLGGWIVKKLQLRCAGILKMCIIFSFFCLLSCLTFVIWCPNIKFAGVNVDYFDTSVTPAIPNLSSQCNSNCSCGSAPFDPICGTNNIMYFSPCHAGCTGMKQGEDGVKVFTGCECVMGLPITPDSSSGVTTTTASSIAGMVGDARLAADSALREKCPSACSYMPLILIILFIVMLLTFIISLPAVAGTLRCVPSSHKSFALGLQWIVVRLLGTIPGPILFGALIDKTCTLWQPNCGKQGSCRSYDNFYMSRYVMGISIISKALSTLFFFLSWYLYVPPRNNQEESQTSVVDNNSETVASPVSKDSKEMRDLRGIDNPAADLT